MLKKIILAVALVALMVPSAFAGRSYLHADGSWSGSPGNTDNPASNPDRETTDNSCGNFEIKAENYNWPASYDFVDAAVIPVKMEVGFWIKLNTKDKVLILKQVEIHKYAGSVTIGIESNVNIEVKGSFSFLSGMPGMEVETVSLNDGGDTTAIECSRRRCEGLPED